MKKILLLLFLFPVIALGQEDLKKSAEDFVLNYIKLFQEKKWDVIQDMYVDDAQMIQPDGKVVPLRETIKSFFDEVSGIKDDVKQVTVDVTGPNSALVMTRFIETRDWTVKVEVRDFFEIYLLERVEGVWKIKKYYFNMNNPLTFSEAIEEKYQKENSPALSKANWAINHGWSLICNDIDYFKQAGITPAESGRIMGERFAKTWNQSLGFDGLVNGFIWGLQIMSTNVEVLERDETTLKAKFLSPVINKEWNITPEDLFIFSQNVWPEIANYMGGICELSVEGNEWILTINKKPE